MLNPAFKGVEPLTNAGLDIKWPIYGDMEMHALLSVLESEKWRRGASFNSNRRECK